MVAETVRGVKASEGENINTQGVGKIDCPQRRTYQTEEMSRKLLYHFEYVAILSLIYYRKET